MSHRLQGALSSTRVRVAIALLFILIGGTFELIEGLISKHGNLALLNSVRNIRGVGLGSTKSLALRRGRYSYDMHRRGIFQATNINYNYNHSQSLDYQGIIGLRQVSAETTISIFMLNLY